MARHWAATSCRAADVPAESVRTPEHKSADSVKGVNGCLAVHKAAVAFLCACSDHPQQNLLEPPQLLYQVS